MKFIKAGVFLFLMHLPSFSFADHARMVINKIKVEQAETIKIQLIRKSTQPFSVNFLGRRHESFLMGKYQTALIGIDYQLKPGTYTLVGVYEDNPKFFLPIRYSVLVKERFPILKYSPPKRSEEEQKKINQESGKTYE